MAGSRLEKFGTIFTRMSDLIRGGVVKAGDVPVWYDVYAAFPPKKDPLYVKPLAKRYGKVTVTVPEIFYKEDSVRAKFYAVYRTGPRVFELGKPTFISTCQRFVDKYGELEQQGEVPEEALFEETAKALLAEGVVLRKRGGATDSGKVAPESRDPVLGMRLKDMLSELQTAPPGKVQAEEEQVQGQSTGTPH